MDQISFHWTILHFLGGPIIIFELMLLFSDISLAIFRKSHQAPLVEESMHGDNFQENTEFHLFFTVRMFRGIPLIIPIYLKTEIK